jgi:hypothetical protein
MANTKNPIKDLLSISSPQEWKDFLFHVENNLVALGYSEMLTKSGRMELSAKFTGLYEFFGDMQEGKQS